MNPSISQSPKPGKHFANKMFILTVVGSVVFATAALGAIGHWRQKIDDSGSFMCPSHNICRAIPVENIKEETKNPEPSPAPISGTGTLTGHVTVGPNCAVEQVGNPCPPTAQANTLRQVGVFTQATASTPEGQTNAKLVASQHLDASGNYRFSLPPGTYDIKASGIKVGILSTFVGTVTIKSGQTTTLNFDLDTGIR